MAARDLIVPLALDEADDSVHVRLSSGFLFWETDYVAMDFSPDQPVATRKFPAVQAVDQKGRDLRAELASEDSLYYHQPSVGDAAELAFDLPPPSDTAWSPFLFCRGYYHILRDPKGRPQMTALSKFKQAGALGNFSKEKLEKIQQGTPVEK